MCIRESSGDFLVAAISSAEKPRKDRTREAASKAQTNSATHALHALSTPMGERLWGEGMKECVNGVGRVGPLGWEEMYILI